MGDYASYQEPITVKKLPGSVQFNGGGGDLEATDRVSIDVLYPGDGSEIGVLTTDDLYVHRDAVISGNLTVTGNTTVINTENLIIEDPIIEIGSNAFDGTTMGLVMQRPSGNLMMGYLSTEHGDCYDNTLVFAYTSGSAYGPTLPVESTPLSVYVNGTLDVSNNFSVGSNLCAGSVPIITADVSTGELNFNDDIKIRNVNPVNNRIAIGTEAGNSNQSSNAIAIGTEAGKQSQGVSSIAMGLNAGNNNQSSNAIAIGERSGQNFQETKAISIGYMAGNSTQNTNSIAIGSSAGTTNQGISSIAIGLNAGVFNQNAHSIAIGSGAGYNNQHSNTIVLNANGGVALNTDRTDALFVKPVRHAETTHGNLMSYDTSTGEITNSNNVRLASLLSNSVVYTNASNTLSTNSDFTFDENSGIMTIDGTGDGGYTARELLFVDVFDTPVDVVLLRGQPVYLTNHANSGSIEANLCVNTSNTYMPSAGLLLKEGYTKGGEGYIVRGGTLSRITDDVFDTPPIQGGGSNSDVGKNVYISNISGKLTLKKPGLATELIQKIGVLIKVSDTSTILILGADRVNDTPNRILAVDGSFSERLTIGKSDIDESANLYVEGTANVTSNLLVGEYVGIGKTVPKWPLDVEGVVRITSQDTQGLLYTTTQPCLNIESSNPDNSVKRPVCLNAFGGNVGVGLTAPSRKLHVKGDVLFSNGTVSYSTHNASSTTYEVGVSQIRKSSDHHRWYTGNQLTELMNLDINGNLTITGSYTPFTGSHTAITSNIFEDGSILISIGTEKKSIIDTSFYVENSTISRDKRVVGVAFTPSGDSNVNIVSLGEGQMCVCDENGDIENGDYICSSNVIGYGMKQGDDLLHNYTVAKATENCLFTESDHKKLISVTFHCG